MKALKALLCGAMGLAILRLVCQDDTSYLLAMLGTIVVACGTWFYLEATK